MEIVKSAKASRSSPPNPKTSGNRKLGFLAAWVLVRYEFPLKRLFDSLVDLPFALPTAVAGLVFVLLFGLQGYFGPWLRDHVIEDILA